MSPVAFLNRCNCFLLVFIVLVGVFFPFFSARSLQRSVIHDPLFIDMSSLWHLLISLR